ncbi:MAG: hypothetical protein DHS20C13_27140 [Thermodesulfobacteriota bacterium]|nr:MAG: hypothetical protein DHS20C13_27140 [Thermodesulfobacteriota bacterium]
MKSILFNINNKNSIIQEYPGADNGRISYDNKYVVLRTMGFITVYRIEDKKVLFKGEN